MPVKGLNLLLRRHLSYFTAHLPPTQLLAAASSLFKSETFLPGDVAEKFPSPCTRGFSSASEPAAFLNRFCRLPSPSVTPPSRRLELTSQTLKRTSRRFCAKDSRAESVPCFLETVDRKGERMRKWKYRNDFIFP